MPIIYDTRDSKFNLRQRRLVSAWIESCIKGEKKRVGEIAIIFCSDDYVLETNRQYLQHDYFTDIITFDYSEGKVLSGDLIISINTVKSNARELKQKFHTELLRVMIHGVLHLVGYGDKSEEESIVMREREDFWIARF